MRKQNPLEKLDAFLDTKTASEVSMYNFGALLLFAALIYFLIFPIAQNYYDDQTTQNQQITQKLFQTNSFLASVSNPQTIDGDRNYKINLRNAELLKYKKQYQDYLDYNNHFTRKLAELSSLTYNGANSSWFLNELTNLAKKYSVQINSITNKPVKYVVNQVSPVLDIGVSFNGRYKDVMRYINAIEESKLIVDINYFDLNSTSSGSDTLRSYINIAIWGMKFQ